jgi:hypothetical protein
MRDFKFFKGQSKELVFLPDNRSELALNERWSWIDEPRITISDFDYNTGAVIDTIHEARNFYCTFSEFIGNIILDSRLFYIFDMTMYAGGQIIDIPQGTTFGEMGVYDWSNNFRIIAVVLYD